MSLTLTLAAALSGLHVAQRALGVTAHNVANVNTEGYVRKIAGQEARSVDGVGQGAAAKGLMRLVDEFLTRELREQSSALGRTGALERFHGRIQTLLGRPGDGHGLGGALANLASALEAFSTTPETAALAHEVASTAQALAERLRGTADGVQTLRREADREIAATVREINDALAAIHDLNREIARLNATGQSAAELEDRRDALVRSLAEKIDIHTYMMDGGRIAIATKHGAALLDVEPRVLVYEPAGHVTADTVFAAITAYEPRDLDPATGRPLPEARGVELVSGGVRAELTPELLADGIDDDGQRIVSTLRSGSLAGLLGMRDRVLPELDDQLQELATVLRHALNAAHNDGIAHPPPSTLTGTRTDFSDFADTTRSGTAYLAVVDRGSGATVATIAVDASLATPAAIAAQIDAGLGALGTAAIDADGRLTVALSDGGHGLALSRGTSSIAVEDAAGRQLEFGFAHYFGLNDLLVRDGARASDLAVRADILADPRRIASARLDVDPGTLEAVLGGRGDNRAAQDLAGALTGSQSFIARGGLASTSSSLAAYAADIVSITASRAAQASTAHERAKVLVDDLEARVGSVSGVNLDEELSRLILFQRAYMASARIVGITDELFETLLAMKR